MIICTLSSHTQFPESAFNAICIKQHHLEEHVFEWPCELNDAPSSSAKMCEGRRCLVHRQRPGNGTQPQCMSAAWTKQGRSLLRERSRAGQSSVPVAVSPVHVLAHAVVGVFGPGAS